MAIKKNVKSILPELEKKDFYDLLHRAVRKDEKVNQKTQNKQSAYDCNDKHTRSNNSEDASGKRKYR